MADSDESKSAVNKARLPLWLKEAKLHKGWELADRLYSGYEGRFIIISTYAKRLHSGCLLLTITDGGDGSPLIQDMRFIPESDLP